jgi:hypothetical protein
VTDVGVLALVLLAIENAEPVFVGSTVEAGAIVLDAAHGFQFAPGSVTTAPARPGCASRSPTWPTTICWQSREVESSSADALGS